MQLVTIHEASLNSSFKLADQSDQNLLHNISVEIFNIVHLDYYTIDKFMTVALLF